MLQALIFDLDGTLIESGPLHFESLQEVLRTYSTELDWSWYRGHLGMTFAQMLEQLASRTGRPLPLNKIMQQSQHLFLNRLERLRIRPGVVALARALQGRLPMAVASNGHRQVVEASLTATGLRALFDTVVTVDDVAEGKPAPDIFIEAARRLGAAPHLCQVFEDSDEGLEAARRAGIPARDVRLLEQELPDCG